MGFDPTEGVIEDIRQGRMVVIIDDPARENEGDLIIAAEKVDAEDINFMCRHGRGVICVALSEDKADALGLPPQVVTNTSHQGTPFGISVEAREGVTTGVSASDRAVTARALARPGARPEDLVRPGHVPTLRARTGGTLARAGHTEAAVDLARLSGLEPVAVICEVMNEDGSMARVDDLKKFAHAHNLKIGTMADLIQHRRRSEKLVRRVGQTKLPTHFGDFDLIAYKSELDEHLHLVLSKGDVGSAPMTQPVLVRIHSECLTGDIFASKRCDCGEQLHLAMEMIEREGCGAIVYLRQEGRGIGLENKIKAYQLQEDGFDTVEANEKLGFPPDKRDYGIGAQILNDLGVSKLRLLTNNPKKMVALEGYGIEISERVPIEASPIPENARYLHAKRTKLGHLLSFVDTDKFL